MTRLPSIGLFLALFLSACSSAPDLDGLVMDAIPGPDAGNPNQMLVWNGDLYL